LPAKLVKDIVTWQLLSISVACRFLIAFCQSLNCLQLLTFKAG